jgi:hypothetical protein
MTDWDAVNKGKQELRVKEAARPYDEKLDVSATINFWMSQPQANRAQAVEKVLLILQEAQQRGVIGDFAIGGSVGIMFYCEPITTRDIDFFVTIAVQGRVFDLSKLYELFATHGYNQFDGQHLVVMGEKFEFLGGDEPIAQDGWSEIREAAFRSTRARVLPLETILAQKLNAGRPRDLAHLGLVFGDFAEKVDKPKFLSIVQRFGLMEKWKRFAQFHGIAF